MLKRRGIVLGAYLLCVALLTGCGVELTELTESEREKIINYSAHVVNEFNTRQHKGYIALSKESLETLDNTEQPEEELKPEEGNPGEENQSGTVTEKNLAMTQALGIDGLIVDGLNYKVTDEYGQGTVFNLLPSDGNRFLVLECKLKNTRAQETAVDIYGRKLEFTIDINKGGAGASSLITILENDLSTLSETFAANSEKAVVLLFEIPQSVADSIENMSLNVKNGSTNHTILMK